MADYMKDVQQLYVAYFSRPADPTGLAFWTGQLQTQPGAYQTLSAAFASSAEYRATYAGMSNVQVVDTVYQHLFGRSAEAQGLSFWADKLDRNIITIDNVVTQIAAGAQGTDSVAYQGKVAVSTEFTLRVDTPAEQAAYSGTAANHLAADFLATITDLTTAASARDPGRIDAVIDSIVAASGQGLGDAGLIGLPEVPPPHFL